MRDIYQNIDLPRSSFQSKVSGDYLTDAVNFRHFCTNVLCALALPIYHAHQEPLVNNSGCRVGQWAKIYHIKFYYTCGVFWNMMLSWTGA